MRIFAAACAGDADQFKDFCRFLCSIYPAELVMITDGLCNLIAYGHHRVQACHGILKNHRDVLAADSTKLLFVHLQQIFSLVQNFSAFDFSVRLCRQAHNSLCQGGLAGTGLAYQSKRASLFQNQVYTIKRLDRSFTQLEMNTQVLHFQNRLIHICPSY